MPPDYGNAQLILGIIGAGAALVYFFYRLVNFGFPMLDRLLWGTQKTAEERSLDLLNRYKEEGSWIQTDTRSISAISPRFHMLRTATQDGNMTCYVINKGGTASNLRIEATGPFHATIAPHHSLGNGQTGNISLQGIQYPSDQVQFELSYDDALGMRVVRSYQYSQPEQKFVEV